VHYFSQMSHFYYLKPLRTTAHVGSIDAPPSTTGWRCRPTLRGHPRGRLDRLTRRQPGGCRRCTSLPLSTTGRARRHRRSFRHLWHRIPLTAPCPSGAWGGGVYTSTVPRPIVWVVVTRAHVIWGVNTNIFPSPSQLNGVGGGVPQWLGLLRRW
jgi:hypothetical protein